MRRLFSSIVICLGLLLQSSVGAERATAAEATDANVAFVEGNGRVAIVVDGLPVAVYCYEDKEITRPFFAHLRAPNGVQTTRHHPAIDGQDLVDHGTFHPGLWMSFGDISGSDYWRLKARVRQKGFVEPPQGGVGKGSFVVHNEYLDQKDPSNVVCNETACYTIAVRPEGCLLVWDSTFSSDHEFAFGDQEEMGIGFRIATPLRVGASGAGNLPAGTGTITNSNGAVNEAAVWGNAAEWCDFSGTVAGERVGMTIFCHPDNFRPSWFHARDYGFLEANPFGREAFKKGEKSSVVVRSREKLRLRYGILIHSGPEGSKPDLASAYQDYLQLAGK